MTDVFFSMNDKSSKKEILQKFQINENIMNLCKPDTVFMHCLPANLGEEVSENIFRSKHSIARSRQKIECTYKNILKWLNL